MAKEKEQNGVSYTEDHIRTLDWIEHLRLRPGMYIGKTGDGSSPDDGIYILVKEVIDNCIDEYQMGYGKKVEIKVNKDKVTVRDYGRGIPLGKLVDVVSKMNTGAKYDSQAFKKSVGLNGVGTKAVNALSTHFQVFAVRDGEKRTAVFERGELKEEGKIEKTDEPNGTGVEFIPDTQIFKNYHFRHEFVETMVQNYTYLNTGLAFIYNGTRYISQRGLFDLLSRKKDPENLRYPIIHLIGEDIEIALTHTNQYGEEYYSFVNGQYTVQGGTHLGAFREAIVKTIRDFYKKDFDTVDIREAICGAISIRIQEPVFESQTKTKLGTDKLIGDGRSMKQFVLDFLKQDLDNFLHKNPETADALLKRIQQSERERKEISGIKKLANERAKKANIHNKKLRDCKVHFNDAKGEERINSTLFITEGDSASGSLTKSRNPETQAVFSLRGKPLNCFGLTKKIVYENEEFNLLQHALNIENSIDDLRYNNVIIATDADVDGMHIRLLLLTFFLQFFPDVVRNGHIKILETPLFRVRDKQQTFYCYDEAEKQEAIKKLRGKPEITRFKGLGEISPEEFERFIGEDMHLSPVIISDDKKIKGLLEYYMGKNTQERQDFIVNNLRVETDKPVLTSEVVEEALV
ncbi:MAG: type IIA DNA topoisomerase subunit B [Chitinophagales bacterium]|nr:type IIA DNA topoisomerase subunit B [Chitinophagales bacterium]MCO5281330.1 type IIA DNA topoisomerase subunit B [Chitinophagales bacterium]OJV29916.1 MAG: DNA topoisomerase IV [Bacteroidetes bacterium 37-13]HRP39068.1 DNA topoisomerase IV subunit B [Chitinophagales bacterium]